MISLNQFLCLTLYHCKFQRTANSIHFSLKYKSKWKVNMIYKRHEFHQVWCIE